MISCTVSAVAATADHRVVLPLEQLVFKQLRRSKTKNQTEYPNKETGWSITGRNLETDFMY